ncbi:MAG: acetylxylan esterase, partial [Bacteroidales bacterium]|nr:acetylxylan esterase [Bacteroidales bacterium]
MKKHFLGLIVTLLVSVAMFAQPAVKKVQLVMIPNHADALYKTGEMVKIKVIALDCGVMLSDVKIDYEVSEDLLPAHTQKSITLKGNEGVINAGTMKQPGYLRVKATVEHEGKKYTYLSTVGFESKKLLPLVEEPKDFEEFWAKNVALLEKVKLNPRMELLPDRCTDDVNVYHVSYGNINNTRIYGVLTMPKKEGKYPAILRLPGYGVHAIGGNVKNAAQGAIILEIGIHGIPVTLEGSVYTDLTYGALGNYHLNGIQDKNAYYYKRVYLGCVKGIDFLLSLPNCNGKVGTLGGSQGGTLSLVTSYLHKGVGATAVYFPAFCDQEAYAKGRTGGYPHHFKNEANRTNEKIEPIRYYDAANCARKLDAPVYFAYGYNDLTCGPTTSMATYNAIPAPKTL